MINRIKLINNWLYKAEFDESLVKGMFHDGFEEINLPHSNVELPYNYFDENEFQIVSCYKKIFELKEDISKKAVYLRFEGVMSYAKVYLNEVYIGEHKGGYTPFEFRIDDYVKTYEANVLTLMVDSTERSDTPPFGGQIDYLTYGGIYRDVSIDIYERNHIRNAQIRPFEIYGEFKACENIVYIHSDVKTEDAQLEFELYDKKHHKLLCSKEIRINLDKGENKITFNVEDIPNIELWDIDNPNLYSAMISLKVDGKVDFFKTRIGFRECKFTDKGFYLNNKNLKIMGLNRHQSYPYSGYAMPKRAQIKDADILKYDLSLNLVRTSHYPQSIEFLDRCDEIGLLVFEEIPGWQHIGDESWQDVAVKNVEEMITRDWNHPSIIIWGVRINESADNDEFYARTNELSRSLDPTRQTGGVRYIDNSNLLEDVYTMNDFVHEGGEIALREQKKVTGLKNDVPYLVTEYNGHMYPTKKFDQEERQMEHVLRHVRVQNESFGMDNVSGAIGWCAFDYNTHKDFGSGDRICYHGVMDMFRNKKFAAYVYKSQGNPEIDPVLMPVTYWARGERSIGGVLPLVILTNCDYIEFRYGDFEVKKAYPSYERFGHLPHPPIVIDESIVTPSEMGEWGMRWEDCIITGFLNGEIVAEKKLTKDPIPSNLEVVLDDSELSSKEKDCTRVTIEAKDQYGNTMPFIDEIITLEINGPGRVIGPKMFTLKGGSFGFWIETINLPGAVNVAVKSTRFDTKHLTIEVR